MKTTKVKRPEVSNVDMQLRDVLSYERMLDDYNYYSEKGYDLMSSSIEAEASGNAIWDSEFKAFLDSSTLKSLFFGEDWVYILVDLVANKISSQYLRVMYREIVEGKEISRPAEGHPLQEKIENPNKYQDYNSWMYGVTVDLTLLGNSVIWNQQINGSLIPVPAESVRLKFSSDGELSNYETVEVSSLDGMASSKVTSSFVPGEIIHLRRPNPSSMFWGLSPFIPGRKSVLFNRYSQDYLNGFYLKGAAPGFALEMDKEANERVALRLLRSFENAYTGRRNQRRTIVLPKGVTLKEVSHTLANQQLSIYIDKNRETIINLLKVPKHELSLQEAGSLGSEEAKSALKNFWYATLIPTMKIIEGGLNRAFKQDLGKDYYIEFDLSNVDALQEDQDQKAIHAANLLKIMTLNEVRKKLYDLGPVEGGDVVIGAVNSNPFGSFGGGFSGASYTDNKESQLPDQSQDIITQDADITSEDTKEITSISLKANPDKLSLFLKSNEGWFDKREKILSDEVSKGVREMERQTLKMFADMAATIIRTTRNYLKEKNYLAMASKAPTEQSKLVKRNELRRRLRTALGKFEEQWISDTRTALLSKVDAGYNASLQIPFNLPSKKEIEGLRVRGEEIRRQALEDRAERAFSYLSETTISNVYSTIDQGIDEGKTIQQISDSLRDRFSNVDEIGKRAMMIARTETLTAVSLGQAAMMEDAKTVIPDMKKMWLTSMDDRVRDTHKELHGDIVGVDQAFQNGLQFPRDPDGPPGETIQCRCTFIPLPAEEMASIDDQLLEANQVKNMRK